MSKLAHHCLAACIGGLAAVANAPAARADSGPVIVVPSRHGVPTVIAGRNANWAVVEGDWGLFRPGHMAPVVTGGTALHYGRVGPKQGNYHPRYGSAPQRGRNEVEPSPDRIMPEPAESFSRSWGTQSDAQHVAKELGKRPYHPAAEVPATLDEPNVFNPPIVIVPRRRP